MIRCKKCILPENYPGIDFNTKGICNYCINESQNNIISTKIKSDAKADLEKTINEVRGKGKNYDCLVSLSGGKDSAYVAYLMKEKYKLKVLGITIDMGFMSKTAMMNIQKVVKKLDIDLIIVKPHEGFYKKVFSYLFTNMSKEGCIPTICYVCGPLTDGISLKLAVEKEIPLIFHGYGPNQPPDTRFFYEFPKSHITGGGFSPEIFNDAIFNQRDKNVFWNPAQHTPEKFLPRVLMPLHVIDYDENKIIKEIAQFELISKRKSSPLATNCSLNWPMIYFQTKKLGYPPYMDFFSDLIREGKASRIKWLLIVNAIMLQIRLGVFKRKEIKNVLNRLGISEKDILERDWD